MPTKQTKLPAIRRQYHSVYGLDSGLDYSAPSTMIAETFTPRCEEVTFRNKIVAKTKGTTYFAGTNVVPLLGTVMYMKQFVQNDESEKLMMHTTRHVYAYNSTTSLPECLTYGLVIEDCEDAWTPSANVTSDVDSTYFRKGSTSVKNTIATDFTTGVAAYENFTAKGVTTYTYLHYYIKCGVATTAGQLRIRLSEQNAGGTGETYADYNVPALTAEVWKEVNVVLSAPDASNGGTYPTDLNAVLSVSLLVVTDIGAQVINIDDVMCVKELTGDIDNIFCSSVINDYYVFSNGIKPIYYWDQDDAAVAVLTGCELLACKAMAQLGDRLCLYYVVSNSVIAPRRVQWTVVGGISVPAPAATDWTDAGSGDTDLDSVFGDDVIMTAHKLGNYVVIYGKKTIVMQEYTGRAVDNPYAFYGRVNGIGVPSERAVANLGDKHIFLGWDDVYLYKGGMDVESIGDKVSDELFTIINPEYINRCFMIYMDEEYEVRLYFPIIGSTTPDTYFTYSLSNGSWSRGSRSYTGFGSYIKVTSDTWHSYGGGTATWDEAATRWDDRLQEALAPINLYGDASGVVYQDNESVYDNVGVAIDSYWETKDFVVGDPYRRGVTNWMEMSFEARGDELTITYSTDLGETWSSATVVTLNSEWTFHRVDFNANSPQVRFRFRNHTLSETFEIRAVQIGYIEGSDRGA